MTWTADGSALSDHANFVRVLNEGGSGKRGSNPLIPYRHGEWSDGDKWFDSVDLLLEVGVKDSDSYLHLSALQKMLGKPNKLVTLGRVTPNAGTVEALVEMLGNPNPTQNRFVYTFPLRVPSGSWRSASVSSQSGTAPSVTTLGDRPIDDMIVTFSAPGTATHTDENGVTSVIGWQGTGTAVVDCGARTIKKAGAHQDANLYISQPWWWRFTPGAAQTISATASITVQWRDKWAAG
jgi:hypothetical protein